MAQLERERFSEAQADGMSFAFRRISLKTITYLNRDKQIFDNNAAVKKNNRGFCRFEPFPLSIWILGITVTADVGNIQLTTVTKIEKAYA